MDTQENYYFIGVPIRCQQHEMMGPVFPESEQESEQEDLEVICLDALMLVSKIIPNKIEKRVCANFSRKSFDFWQSIASCLPT